jgi:hypothetical protein
MRALPTMARVSCCTLVETTGHGLDWLEASATNPTAFHRSLTQGVERPWWDFLPTAAIIAR